MRRAYLLAAVAVLVAACVSPEPPASHATGFADPQGLHASATPGAMPWAAYREFNFDSTTADISTSDVPKLREIVTYLESDSSLDVGIDGIAEGASQTDRSLSNRRAASVRRALMDTGAGVASYKILMGPFAVPNRRRAGQIQVLVGPRTGLPKTAL